ncbi:DUF1735 domain-containing protein [Flavivirga amylovorans]|uniref:DUF1735 domain-containing protein n=1 Tax=Flavivirga amylovorans TaxID=870486 RepID=A0ABT8WX23_9FLAO|nr:DUF1735 domain-containing protein [Flavivirga amylovorans]MDO5986235.1 DUF1735 domain-containing protein [Flavivirga amylovorans]
MKYKNCMLVILLFTVIAVSCESYEDYLVNSVGYKTVYFPNKEYIQETGRSMISGEGLEINIGAYLGGVKENNNDEEVTFEIDQTLLDGTPYTLLPSDHYTLSSDDKIIIPKGKYLGLLNIKFDSLRVANDDLFQDLNYAIPLRMVATSVDSILEGNGDIIVPIKLINTYEGNFYQSGSLKEFFTVSKVLDTAYVYGDREDGTNDPVIRKLSSIMMDTVKINGVANRTGDDYSMKLKVNPEDNSVTIISDPDSVIEVEENGFSLWNPVNRKFTLKYKYTIGDKDFEVEEVLTFRNRIRDGINEWRWEGFPGN